MAHYRRLCTTRPAAFLPDLARGLNNLGNRLSDLDRREEALAATRESVAYFRTLFATHPDAFLSDLATSLNNLGSNLSDLGRREEALAAAEEAVRILVPSFFRHPGAFRDGMAILARNYLDLAEATGREADRELLEPLLEPLGLTLDHPALPLPKPPDS